METVHLLVFNTDLTTSRESEKRQDLVLGLIQRVKRTLRRTQDSGELHGINRIP